MRVLNITDDVLSPVLYGMNDDSLNDYYREKLSSVKRYITNDSYHKDNYSDYEYRYSNEYISRVKRSLNQMELYGNDNENIYYYKDTREANDATIEWIMASKRIRKLYDRGLVNGYSSTNYKHNEYSTEVKYMSVMDGHFSDDNFDGFVEYYNSDIITLPKEDREVIVKNWNRAMSMFNNNIDPTDK